MSMDTEEMIAAQPCDAVVLIGGELLLYVDEGEIMLRHGRL